MTPHFLPAPSPLRDRTDAWLSPSSPDREDDPSAPSAPDAAPRALTDRWGRTARDLRVSLTDRCNLRCTYCMPEEGMDWLQRSDLLTDEEVVRLVTIAVTYLGIHEVRFTGGEPLMRRGLESIVARTSRLRTDRGTPPDISLTTNGLGLTHRAAGLHEAGLDRVNISLDTVDRATYARMSRRDRLPDVIAGIDAAVEAGLAPVKINAVAARGANDRGLPDLLDFCLDRGLQLRIIEEMPLGPRSTWDPSMILGESGILELLGRDHALTPAPQTDLSAPARLWDVAATGSRPGGTVGIIASVTDSFCATCDRTRVTADGQMRPCLFGDLEVDLRALLRSDADDDTLITAWTGGMALKAHDHGGDGHGMVEPTRRMSAIGG